MQVSHVQDHVTHAVIGGGQSIEFGISNSAEFFNILSSTLYKDQILAVVREVLCNAWDAHIEAGIQHKPVQITLSEDKFIIKDFGKGIHRDDMGIIYGTYGNSTKKNDGTQTGGFGLGCKAPFAYTDHFEVISCHDGVKTIYNLSKSSAQAMGKPGIIPIASFPTTDTGLQVSINIKDLADFRRYNLLVKRIAHNGDMNMTLNEKPISKLGFNVDQANYLVTGNDELLGNQTNLMVRYGNVIYPIESDTAIAEQYASVMKFLIRMETQYRKLYLVFQAPPHSISVTPSRESLSMQEHTVKTLNNLFKEFLVLMDTPFKASCEQYMGEVVQEAVKEKRIDVLLRNEEVLPFTTPETDLLGTKGTNSLADLAKMSLRTYYPKGSEFRKKDVTLRLKSMVAAGLLDRGLIDTFLRELGNLHHTNWLQRRIIAPLVTKMSTKAIDVDRLFVLDPTDANWHGNNYGKEELPLVRATSACPRLIYNALPYLRKIVVVATSRNKLIERAYRHDVFKQLGKNYGFFLYHCSMKKADKEAALAFFKAEGMQVVDLTVRQSWEDTPSRSVSNGPRAPAKKGVAALSSVWWSNSKSVDFTGLLKDDAVRTEKPEFILQVSLQKDFSKSTIPGWDAATSRHIVQLFGDKGGITNNSNVFTSWINKGVKPLQDYVLEHVCMEVMTNPRIQEYWAYAVERSIDERELTYDLGRLARTVYGNETLRKIFGLVNNLTTDDRKYLALWSYIKDSLRRFTPTQLVIDSVKQMEAIPLAKENKDCMEKLIKNKLIYMLNIAHMVDLLNEAKTKKDDVFTKQIMDVLMTILNM